MRPKIVYPETTQGAYFAYDEEGFFIDKTCFMMITDHAEYLQNMLSSKLFEFAYKRIFSSVELGEHGYQYNKHALVKLPILQPATPIPSPFGDETVYALYGINEEEHSWIEESLL